MLYNAGEMANGQKQQLKHLLVETIKVLCKNSLLGESSFCIEATIGITLSNDHAMVISFKERIDSHGSCVSLMKTDEEERKQQSTSDEAYKLCDMPYGCSSSNTRGINNENPTMHEQTGTLQTHGNARSVDQEVGLLESNVVNNGTFPPRMALFEDPAVSAANHSSIPATGQSYTATTQSSADCENDSEDSNVVIVKVEESDNVAAVSDIEGFGTDSVAPPVWSGLTLTNEKQHRARYAGNFVRNRRFQPMWMSACRAATEMHHVDDSHHKQVAAHNEPYDSTKHRLNDSNSWSQSKTVWSCSLCGACLGSSRTLRTHVLKKHMALKTERCRLCGERFRWSGQVVRHKRLCHPESL